MSRCTTPITRIPISGPIRANPWSGRRLFVRLAASSVRGEPGLVPDDSTAAMFDYTGDSVLLQSQLRASGIESWQCARGKDGSDWPRWDTDDGMSMDVIVFELSTAHPHDLTHPSGFRLKLWQAEELP
jgi:hypothetical protein